MPQVNSQISTAMHMAVKLILKKSILKKKFRKNPWHCSTYDKCMRGIERVKKSGGQIGSNQI